MSRFGTNGTNYREDLDESILSSKLLRTDDSVVLEILDDYSPISWLVHKDRFVISCFVRRCLTFDPFLLPRGGKRTSKLPLIEFPVAVYRQSVQLFLSFYPFYPLSQQ